MSLLLSLLNFRLHSVNIKIIVNKKFSFIVLDFWRSDIILRTNLSVRSVVIFKTHVYLYLYYEYPKLVAAYSMNCTVKWLYNICTFQQSTKNCAFKGTTVKLFHCYARNIWDTKLFNAYCMQGDWSCSSGINFFQNLQNSGLYFIWNVFFLDFNSYQWFLSLKNHMKNCSSNINVLLHQHFSYIYCQNYFFLGFI